MRKPLILAIALLVLLPALAFAQYAFNLKGSPTATVTQNLFLEPSDQYLNVWEFYNLTDATFMLDIQPTNTAPTMLDIGLGSWFGGLYGAGYYGYNQSTVSDINLGGGVFVSTLQSQTDSLIFGGAGNLDVIGKTSTITTRALYTETLFHDPVFLVGFKVGDMTIGVANEFTLNSQYQYGTFAPINLGAPFPNPTALTSSTITQISDTTGVVSYLNSKEFAVGKSKTATGSDSTVDTVTASFIMPLGGNMTLKALAGVGFGLVNGGTDSSGTSIPVSSYAYEEKLEQVGFGYATYTPTLALPGVTPVALDNLQHWFIEFYNTGANGIQITPSLAAEIIMPVSIFGGATFKGGLSYGSTLSFFSTSTTDATGTAVTGGQVTNTQASLRDAVLDTTTGFIQITTNDYRSYQNANYTANSSHTISIPVSLNFAPNKDFSFAIGFQPKLFLSFISANWTSQSIKTTIVDDGSGIPAATNPADSTTVTTTIGDPYTESANQTSVDLALQSGVQVYVMPEKLRLNFGANLDINLIDRTTYSKTYTGLGGTTVTSTVAGVTNTTTSNTTLGAPEYLSFNLDFNNSSLGYQAGLTFFLNPNVFFDFWVLNNAAFNLAAFTDVGGFFNLKNYTIQMTIQLPASK